MWWNFTWADFATCLPRAGGESARTAATETEQPLRRPNEPFPRNSFARPSFAAVCANLFACNLGKQLVLSFVYTAKLNYIQVPFARCICCYYNSKCFIVKDCFKLVGTSHRSCVQTRQIHSCQVCRVLAAAAEGQAAASSGCRIWTNCPGPQAITRYYLVCTWATLLLQWAKTK